MIDYKEFVVDYKPHESAKLRNVMECTVKIKTDSELVAKDVPEYDLGSYIKALRDLGYQEVFYIPYWCGKEDEYLNAIKKIESEIEDLQNQLSGKKIRLEDARKNLDDAYNNECQWWDDVYSESGY